MSDVPRFLDHVKNGDSPGPPIGSHHAFFSDDQEPCPVTDIADLIRDSYEVPGPHPAHRPPPPGLSGGELPGRCSGLLLACWLDAERTLSE